MAGRQRAPSIWSIDLERDPRAAVSTDGGGNVAKPAEQVGGVGP